VVEGSRRLLPYGLAAASGLALTCSFAPLAVWPLAVLSPALLMWLWSRAPTPRTAAWLGFCHGVATFATGTWWLYISLHGFGGAPIAIALLLLAGLVLLMAAYYAALGYVLKRYLSCAPVFETLLVMPCAWLLTEWLRGWFLSGFPWLSLGYSQTDTPLAGLAPVGGVYLVSAAVLLSAGGLVTTLRSRSATRGLGVLALLLPRSQRAASVWLKAYAQTFLGH
jgi:apolipoprotein N-acyltransferase